MGTGSARTSQGIWDLPFQRYAGRSSTLASRLSLARMSKVARAVRPRVGFIRQMICPLLPPVACFGIVFMMLVTGVNALFLVIGHPIPDVLGAADRGQIRNCRVPDTVWGEPFW